VSGTVYLDRATRADAAELAAVIDRCQSHPWTAAQVEDELAAAGGEVLVCRALDRGASRIVASCACRLVLDELQVMDVSVLPAWRRRGLAGRLLRLACARARRRGASRALLEVRAGNAGAIALYEGLGFVRRGTRRAYYGQPVEDAVLLDLEMAADEARGSRLLP
jgi:ribosomal-protein-alanine N-acetyltransferase